MKRKHIVLLFFLVSLTVVSCSKMETLFTNGELVTEERSLSQRFSSIAMYNNVNVKLVRSNRPHLELTCPKNLIDKIYTEIDSDTLVIKNENEYNWLRSYDYSINLTVYYDSLRAINYASIGNLLCTDSIHGILEKVMEIDTSVFPHDTSWIWTKSFNLNINEGCGKIDLLFNGDVVKCIFGNGTSEVSLKGIAAYTEIIMRSYGVVHAENLNSDFVRVQSNSTNDTYVWPRTRLTAWLNSIGDIYYHGNPEIVIKTHGGEGRIIKLE